VLCLEDTKNKRLWPMFACRYSMWIRLAMQCAGGGGGEGVKLVRYERPFLVRIPAQHSLIVALCKIVAYITNSLLPS
jgi:hypothetical protein